VGGGQGLGLAIVHGAVRALRGEIAIESQVGRGSRFRVSMPAAPAPSPPVAVARLRVLVIDDEEAVARILARRLSRRHDARYLCDARAALAELESGTRFDVMLVDLMMPGLSGMKLHAEVRRLDAAQAGRMVFMTGGAFTDEAERFLDEVPNRRLLKPIEPQLLDAAIDGR
jgi:CheY-like chemotaxis protein